MMRYVHFVSVVLLLFSNGTFVQAQQPDLPPIDSALSWLAKNYVENPDSFHPVALRTLSRAYALNEPVKIAEAHSRLADWHGYHLPFNQDSVVHHSEQQLAYFMEADSLPAIAQTYRILSIDYLNAGKFTESQDAGFKALEAFEKLGNEQEVGSAYRSLSTIFMVQEQPEQSIIYGRKALQTIDENGGEASVKALAMINLISSYNQLEQYGKAIAIGDSCIDLIEKSLPDEFGIASRAYGHRGGAHLHSEDYQRALADYTKAWDIVRAVVGEERAATYRYEIGKTLQFMDRNEEAIPHLEAGLAAMEEIGTQNIWEPYQQLARAYEATGNIQGALTYQKEYIRAYQNMLDGKLANVERETAIKYETQKKDEALSQQAIEIRQQKRINYLSIGIAALFALFMIVLFFLYRRINKTAASLQEKNEENVLLIREIHHRVKNNLDVVSSLLRLQATKTEDVAAKGVIEASQNRVKSMGILHQKLYQGEDMSTIDMLDYFENLTDNILDVFQAHDKIAIKLEMENLSLDIDTAVPIGLIVNELMTNSLKYAFTEKEEGEIEISLREVGERDLALEVADNGIGIEPRQAAMGTGFGSQLVQLLTKQLNGSLQTDLTSGTRFKFLLGKANV